MRGKAKLKRLQEYFLYFMMYSILGWIYEVFLEVVVYRWGFSNRGALLGPYCVVYGFGAIILIFLLSRLKNRRIPVGGISITPVLVFAGIVVITTITELIASYLMEFTRGEWMWDYTRFSFNFQGRIALNPSIRFGIGGMVFLYILQPLFCRAAEKLGERNVSIISRILAVILLADIFCTFVLNLH